MTETREQQERNHEAEREAQASVREMTGSWVWKEVARPSLKRRLRVMERALALGQFRGLEETRYMQGQHAMLRELLAEPMGLLAQFGNPIEEGE